MSFASLGLHLPDKPQKTVEPVVDYPSVVIYIHTLQKDIISYSSPKNIRAI